MRQLGQDIWISEGRDVEVAGFHYPTRMAVIRLSGDRLFIWSPVQLTEGLQAELNALGRVSYLVSPNSLHHLFLADWKRVFTNAKLFAPPGLRRKRPDVAFDGDLSDEPPPEWNQDIQQVVVRGNLITTEIVFFHVTSRTALFADLLQQIPHDRLSGWRMAVARLDLMVGPEPSVPRKFRIAFVGRAAAQAALRHILAWPTEAVIMAHGTPVVHDARAYLRRAFGWLVKNSAQ